MRGYPFTGSPRPNKYGAKRVEALGRMWDSGAEAKHAVELDMLRKAGAIEASFAQVQFYLGCPENTYRPDFLIFGVDSVWVDEIKGFQTEKFMRDKRLWKKYGPCTLRVIRGKKVETIESLNPWTRAEILAGLKPKGTRWECVRPAETPSP